MPKIIEVSMARISRRNLLLTGAATLGALALPTTGLPAGAPLPVDALAARPWPHVDGEANALGFVLTAVGGWETVKRRLAPYLDGVEVVTLVVIPRGNDVQVHQHVHVATGNVQLGLGAHTTQLGTLYHPGLMAKLLVYDQNRLIGYTMAQLPETERLWLCARGSVAAACRERMRWGMELREFMESARLLRSKAEDILEDEEVAGYITQFTNDAGRRAFRVKLRLAGT